MKSSVTERLLLIGYGNTLRGDDALGPRLAEALAGRWPDVDTRVAPQLLPELADPIHRAAAVIFLDAGLPSLGAEVRVMPLAPSGEGAIEAHRLHPAALLGFTEKVFGRVPPAWLVSVPARQFDFGAALSPEATRSFQEALARIEALVRQLRSPADHGCPPR